MVKLLNTRILNYRDLCSKELINDLKEAATCETVKVCSLPCNRCPYILKNIDTQKIHVKGLYSYNVQLIEPKNEQLLLSINAPDIDNWLKRNNIPLSSAQNNTQYLDI